MGASKRQNPLWISGGVNAPKQGQQSPCGGSGRSRCRIAMRFDPAPTRSRSYYWFFSRVSGGTCQPAVCAIENEHIMQGVPRRPTVFSDKLSRWGASQCCCFATSHARAWAQMSDRRCISVSLAQTSDRACTGVPGRGMPRPYTTAAIGCGVTARPVMAGYFAGAGAIGVLGGVTSLHWRIVCASAFRAGRTARARFVSRIDPPLHNCVHCGGFYMR